MESRNSRKKIRYNSRFLYLITIIISILILFFGNKVATMDLTIFDDEIEEEIVKARVESIEDRIVDEYDLGGSHPIQSVQILFQAKFLSGDNKGETILASQSLDSSMPLLGTTEVKEGDKILLFNTDIEEQELTGAQQWQFAEFVRTDKLLILGILLAMALIIFGQKKGFNTILSLAFTCLAIFAVFIPSILSGKNIYLWAILVCLYTIVMTYLIVNGYNKKTLAASLGCFSGIILSGLLTVIMNKVLALTGVIDDDSLYLTYIFPDNPINLRAIIFAAIIIGAMGAIMDVSISISSSLWELQENARTVSFDVLFKSGLNIGKDIMGTMANTLILAYIGSSLSVVLLLSVYSSSLIYLLNREMVIVEILQALVGSFGILLAMPLTSLISSFLYTRTINRG